MQETQILSTPSPAATATPKRALVFDACHAGVVLRAVLFVEAVAGVGAMFATETPAQWLAVLALLTGGVLPATLAWLLVACSLKVWLQRLSIAQQYTAGVLLGTLAGLLPAPCWRWCWPTTRPGWPAPPPARCSRPCWWRA